MNKVEKIKAYLERRIAEITDISQGYIANKQMSTEYLLLFELLAYIDSLSDTEKDFGIKESVIPFGASDSELMEATYFIPQGFHAVIEGDKVIIRKGEESVSRAFQIDGEYTNGGFTGLLPAWIDAPSTLQPAHKWHGRNVVAVHEKNGGFRCCLIDEKVPFTFHLPENTGLVSGWKKKPVSNDLEEAAHSYVDTTIEWFDSEGNPCCYPAFIAGAQWQKEQMIDKVCKWLVKHWREYVWLTDNDIIHFGHWEHDFKKAMEE